MTYRDLLSKLPAEVSEKAINNAISEKTADKEMFHINPSTIKALRGGFSWQHSPEGFNFWYKISKGLKNESIKVR